MKKIILFLLFFCLTEFLHGQTFNKEADSLSRALIITKIDSQKVNILNAISKDLWRTGYFDAAMDNANQALTLAKKIDFKKGMATAYNNIGATYIKQTNYSEGIENYLISLDIRREMNDELAISSSYINMGNAYLEEDDYVSALRSYFAALKIGETTGDSGILINAYNSIGNVYSQQGNYPEALKNYFTSLKMTTNNPNANSMIHVNIGEVYTKQKNYEGALKNFQNALEMQNTAIGDVQIVSSCYGDIGNVYMHEGKYEMALKSYLKALEIQKRMDYKYDIADSYVNIGKIYLKLHKEHEAEKYLYEGLLLAKDNRSKIEIKEAYGGLSELDTVKGDMKGAFRYYLLYSLMKDSLINEESNKQISQLKIQYETEKKNKEIEIKNISIEKQKATIRYLIIGFILLSIFALIYFRLYNQKKRTAFKHQVLETEMKALRSQMNPHFTFNVLNSIQYYVGGNDMKSVELYLNKFSTLIRMILDQSRNAYISLEQEIKMLKLYLELEEMLFEKKFNYRIEIAEGINTEKILIPSMLIQPIVENSIKHGIAQKKGGAIITISISTYQSTLRCLVKDNGIGRAAAQKLKTSASFKSVAIDIIKERIEALSSLYNIHLSYKTEDLFNSEGEPEGTCVSIEIPFKNLELVMVNT